MARDGWFDGKGLDLINSTREAMAARWADLMADGLISTDEIVKFRQEIYSDLKILQDRLPDDIHAELTKVLIKYEMLIELHQVQPKS